MYDNDNDNSIMKVLIGVLFLPISFLLAIFKLAGDMNGSSGRGRKRGRRHRW